MSNTPYEARTVTLAKKGILEYAAVETSKLANSSLFWMCMEGVERIYALCTLGLKRAVDIAEQRYR